MDVKKELEEGMSFAKTANGMAKKGIMDNQTIYHIVCMAVEKLASALLAKVDYIPEHSELNFIFRELSKKMDIPDSYINEVRFLNRFMTYCSVDFVEPKPIEKEDMDRMLGFVNGLEAFAVREINE